MVHGVNRPLINESLSIYISIYLVGVAKTLKYGRMSQMMTTCICVLLCTYSSAMLGMHLNFLDRCYLYTYHFGPSGWTDGWTEIVQVMNGLPSKTTTVGKSSLT